MTIGDPTVVDMILEPTNGCLVLLILDPGEVADPDERMRLFVNKLRTYVGWVMSEDFRAQYPTIGPKNVVIRLVHRVPPTERMLAISAVTPHGDKENQIKVEYEFFKGADELRSPQGGSQEDTDSMPKGPWWKFWN